MSNKLNLQRVYFEGFQNSESYFNKSKILLFTSNFEGKPMVIPEAMSYGTLPVIMNTYSGTSVHIEDNFNGFLTKAFSIDDMVTKTESLMLNESLITKMSKKSVDSIKKFDITVIGPVWSDLINHI